jgi:hypothetical protein
MTFVTPLLLAGAALIAVPIILHLIMRRKPKWLEFPALRFVQKRHDKNKRSLRLRHIILLILRAAIIGLMAFALARPTVQFGGSFGNQEAPVAAGLVFDTAAHIDYRHENQTRLDAAKKLGSWLLSQLPSESEIAVLDTHLGGGAFQVDRGAARQRIERLEVVPNSQPLANVLDEAIRLLKESKLERKELYIFTDLSQGSWPPNRAAQLRERLATLPGVGIYVIDVGVKDPVDFALGEIRLSSETLSNRGSLTISTDLTSIGGNGDRAVELNLLDKDGKPETAGVQNVSLMPGESRQVEFRKESFALGVHQGYLRIVGQDGLAADDTRYFTVEAKPAWRVLLVAPNPVDEKAFFLSNALAPSGFRKRGQARFECDTISFDELAKKPPAELADYAAVCLLDPPPLEPNVWRTLTNYASDGHGVGVFLGRNALPLDKFNNPQAMELLPGGLKTQVPRPDADVYLAPRDLQHPILAPFRAKSGEVPWAMFPVLRYWELAKLHAGVSVVMAYNDGRPALLERPLGSGRVLVLTTPVSDDPNDKRTWNLLPVNDAWPFVILANQIASYLVGSSNEQFNYFAGQTAMLQLDPKEQRTSFLLTTPDGEGYPLTADAAHHRLVVSTTDLSGNYRIRAGGKEGGLDRGFSVNLSPEQTQLARMAEKELKGFFEPYKINLAQTKEQIDRSVIKTRVGRELFPPLIIMVAVVLAMELVLSNKFYRG